MSKINHIFTLMQMLSEGRELYAQDTRLQDELDGVNERTLRRYLEEIHTLYQDMIVTHKKPKEFADRKVTVYRVIDPKKDVSDVLRFFLENDNELSWVLQLLVEQDPTLLEYADEAKDAIQRSISKESDVFLFVSKPFELFEDAKQKNIFKNLRDAVKRMVYRNIEYNYNGTVSFKDVKCLKIIFSENNWYLAGETSDGKFRWFRLSFISNVSYSSKNSYQKHILEKYDSFFERIENPFTLFDADTQEARIVAKKEVAHYFKEGMKPFFKSQKFIRQNDDGSVEFSVKYTQPMEILPFVKKWMPSLKIVAPNSLKELYRDDLRSVLDENTCKIVRF